jgi:hypothetical protein
MADRSAPETVSKQLDFVHEPQPIAAALRMLGGTLVFAGIVVAARVDGSAAISGIMALVKRSIDHRDFLAFLAFAAAIFIASWIFMVGMRAAIMAIGAGLSSIVDLAALLVADRKP